MRGTDADGRRLVLVAGRYGPLGIVDSRTERWRIASDATGSWIESWGSTPIVGNDVVRSSQAVEASTRPIAASAITADLLLLYTPELAASLGSPDTVRERLVLIAEILNDTLAASAIEHRLNLVGIESSTIANGIEASDAVRILAADAATAARRDAHGADAVMLLRRKATSGSGGAAFVFAGPDAPPRPFGVADLECTGTECIGEDTVLHEMGHIMGGGHSLDDPWDYGPSGWRSYSNAFVGCGVPEGETPRSSIIARVGLPVRLYSNPSVSNEGVVCGDPLTADNARTIREALPYIAALRDAPQSNAPAIGLAMAPQTIPARGTAELVWFVLRATSCSATGDWTGTKSTSGTESVTPATPGTYSYSLHCSGPAGSHSGSVTLTVTAAPQPSTATPGASASSGSGAVGCVSLLALLAMAVIRTAVRRADRYSSRA